jgi:hypothetical protein
VKDEELEQSGDGAYKEGKLRQQQADVMYHLSQAQREGTSWNIHNVIVPSQHAQRALAYWLHLRHGWGAVLQPRQAAAAPRKEQRCASIESSATAQWSNSSSVDSHEWALKLHCLSARAHVGCCCYDACERWGHHRSSFDTRGLPHNSSRGSSRSRPQQLSRDV